MTNPKVLAKRIYLGDYALSELIGQLADGGVKFERTGHDWYDNSLELHGVPDDFRLTPVQQKIVYDAGFQKCYVNHLNHWETHYNWVRGKGKSFKPDEGWRVQYPHKDNRKGPILVESHVPSWPQDWFDTGYVKIVPSKAKRDAALDELVKLSQETGGYEIGSK